MFGMHIRSVLIGLHAENVNTDPKMLIQLMFGVGKVCVCGGSKIAFLRSLEALEGTFIRVHMIVWDAYWKCSEWFGSRKCE